MDDERREQSKRAKKGEVGSARKTNSHALRLRELVYREGFLLVVLSLLVAAFITPTFLVNECHYRLGDVAEANIKAKHDFVMEDELPTMKKREEALHKAPLVYDFDESIRTTTLERLDRAFESMRQSVRKNSNPLDAQSPPALPDRALEMAAHAGDDGRATHGSDRSDAIPANLGRKGEFESLLGCEVPEAVFLALLHAGFNRDIQDRVAGSIDNVLERGLVADKALFAQPDGKPLVLRNMQAHTETAASLPVGYYDSFEAQQFFLNQAADDLREGDLEVTKGVLHLCLNLIRPNLTFNLEETENRQELAVRSIKPVTMQLKQNEMLVREGQKIGPVDLAKLRAHEQDTPKRNRVLVFVSLFLLTALSISVFVTVSRRHLPAFSITPDHLLFLALLLVFLLTFARCAAWLGDAVGDASTYFNGRTLFYAIPVASGAMLSSIFFGVNMALIFSLLASMLVALLVGKNFELFPYFLLGSLVAAHSVATCRNRMEPIRAGVLVGCVNVCMIVLALLLQDQLLSKSTLSQLFLGFGGGLFAGVLVTGLTPLAEMLFGYTTDMKLLELASMDQPLLQELMMQAPGTYHHSIIVGNMVEAAAKSISANSLLAKVAAYYHDIGKTRKSPYFIENQFDNENRHDKLSPSMSSLILISHVKEGIELARQHRLGKPIVDIISQHHGTRMISFFYQKALEARETKEKARTNKTVELPPIRVEDYRYPGPKPQTKEAGLVMLADVVEAACRALPEPTPARIQGMVNKLINNIFTDGQLDECELTLKDLHHIARRFNQILATLHHKRIEYPAPVSRETKNRTNADSHQRETKADRDRPAANEEGGKADLKRLGLH
jgi:hypothetical protein